MKTRLMQNLLFSLIMTAAGAYANVFHTVVDQMALSMGRRALDVGLYISTYAIGSLCSTVLSSALADREGKRRIVAAGLLMMGLGFLVIYRVRTEGLLLLGLFLFGFGFSPAEGMGSALISDMNQHRGSLWMNIAHAGYGLGAIAGPVLAIAFLSSQVTYHELFLGCAVSAAVFLLLVVVSGRGQERRQQGSEAASMNMFNVLKDGRFRLLALTIFLYLGYESVAPAYIKQLFLRAGESEDLSMLMISLFWGSMIIGRLIGTFLTGKEPQSIRYYSYVAIVGFVLLLLSTVTALRVLAVGLIGLGCGPVWPMLVSLAAQRFPARTGAAIGMMMLCSMAGITIFPPLIGTLPANLNITFVLCAVLATLVSFSGLLMSKKAGQRPADAV